MTRPSLAPRCGADAGCITCADEGLPLRVRRIEGESGLAVCEDEAGHAAEVDVSLVAPVAVGDVVLAHAGVALTRLEGAA